MRTTKNDNIIRIPAFLNPSDDGIDVLLLIIGVVTGSSSHRSVVPVPVIIVAFSVVIEIPVCVNAFVIVLVSGNKVVVGVGWG